jgi:tripartite-type tricarboxylate transporter receptor subunit TctC
VGPASSSQGLQVHRTAGAPHIIGISREAVRPVTLIAGHVELLIGSIALAMPQIEPGAVRAVVQMGHERASALPDVATLIESGFAEQT